MEPPDVTAFLAGQRRVLTERCGVVDPGDVGDAIHRGAYAAFAAALAAGNPAAVIETVKTAALQGRGGAYFPAAVKWEGARQASGEPKYLIVNGEEGEPGIFKDRHLLEGDPHRLLEGALLAAYAAGASHIYLYVHGEANLAARRLERALEGARRWGLVSRHVLGSDFSVDVEVRRGAGGFVLGEETALHGVPRGAAGDAAGQAALSRRVRAVGPADRDQQRRDALRGAAHRGARRAPGGRVSAAGTA